MITRVKGTQDVLDLQLRNFLLNKIRLHMQKYNFIEILTPVMEKSELFLRTVGDQTDIVGKEMYFVGSRQGGDEELCLRPELTACVMRAFLNEKIQTIPWKVFTYGPLFRHERPQKGRYREFYQVSIESIGSSSPLSDAYFIAMLDRFYAEELKLDSYALIINYLGCGEDRERYKEALRTFVDKHAQGACKLCIERKDRAVLRILDCKAPECQALYASAPVITGFLCIECADQWRVIGNVLGELSVSYTHAPYLVRGLDYYSKTVFEFVATHTLGAQSAFCAGGRYDTIASQLGSSHDFPAIGAAIGVERVLLLLEGTSLPIPPMPPLHLILPFTVEQQPLALQVADELHASGLRADLILETASLKSMMRKADARGARTCILIGPDELAAHAVTIKDMKTGQDSSVPQTAMVTFLKQLDELGA